MAEGNALSGVGKLVGTLLKPIISVLTPILRDKLEDFLRGWYADALETDSPYDDIAAEVVLAIFGVTKA